MAARPLGQRARTRQRSARRKKRSNAGPGTCRSRPRNCRRKSNAPAWARTCNRCPRPPSAISACRRPEPAARKETGQPEPVKEPAPRRRRSKSFPPAKLPRPRRRTCSARNLKPRPKLPTRNPRPKPKLPPLKRQDGDKPAEAKPEPNVHIADGSVPAIPAKPKATPKKPKPITVASTPHDRQLPVAAAGFSPAPRPDRQADRVEGRIDGQRAADAADARAVRHRSVAGRHHQRPDHHALRTASRARREAGKNHRAQQQHRRRAQGRTHPHPRARARQKLRRRRSAQPDQDQGHHARPARVRGMAQHARRASRWRWARTFMAIRSSPTSRRCRTCSSPAAPAPANPFASTPSSPRCSTASRPTSSAS